jgi:hypothetical protein
MGRIVVFGAGGRPPARQPHRSATVLLWPEGSQLADLHFIRVTGVE